MNKEPIPKLDEGSLLASRDELPLVPLESARSLDAIARIELDTASLFSLLVFPCAGRMDEDEAGELGRERTLLCLGSSLLHHGGLALSKSLTPLVSARSLEANARIKLDAASLYPLLVLSRFGIDEAEVGALNRERTLFGIGGSFLKCDELPLVMSLSQTPLASSRSLVADACIVLDVTSLLSLPLHPRLGTDEAKVGALEPKRTLLCICGLLLHRGALALSSRRLLLYWLARLSPPLALNLILLFSVRSSFFFVTGTDERMRIGQRCSKLFLRA